MKYYYIILCIFCWFKPDIEIISAYQKIWQGGREESGRKLELNLSLISNKNSENIRFLEIKTQKESFRITKVFNPNTGNNTFNAGDTINIIAFRKSGITQSQGKCEMPGIHKKNTSQNSGSAILISEKTEIKLFYLKNGKTKSLEIDKLEIKKNNNIRP